jgi:hypothetical protein
MVDGAGAVGRDVEARPQPLTGQVQPSADAIPAASDATPSTSRSQTSERPEGFPTEALLAAQDAEALELRAELDQLRRVLDDGLPALSPVRGRSGGSVARRTGLRRPLIGVLVTGGTLGLIATATLLPWSSLDLFGRDGASSAATADPAARIAAARPAVAGPGGQGIDRPGAVMQVKIGRGGVLTVVEQAVLGPRGARTVKLRLPSMTSLRGSVAALRPRVLLLRASVNGAAVAVRRAADGSGWIVAANGRRARTVRLSYRLAGAVALSHPSDAGRALAVALPLLGQAMQLQGLPLQVRAEGAAVGGATCPSAPATKMLCGLQLANGWAATVPAEATSPVVLLQLNLGAG